MYRVTILVVLLIAFASSTGHAASVGVRLSINLPPHSLLYCHNAIRIAREAGRPTHDLPQCRGFKDYVRAVGADRTAPAGSPITQASSPSSPATRPTNAIAPPAGMELSMAQAQRRVTARGLLIEVVAP